MIVVDTNIICYFYFPNPQSDAVAKLFKQDSHWIAPALWQDEFTNILCTMERNKIISAEHSFKVLQQAQELMHDCHFHIPPQRTLAVARRTGCSGYDSQFIALAEDLGLKLFTFDKKILKAVPKLAKLPH